MKPHFQRSEHFSTNSLWRCPRLEMKARLLRWEAKGMGDKSQR
jgi:hypothetical protein